MLLNCHTYFSLRYGTLSVERLLEKTQKHNIKRFVLTDINNTSAFLDTLRQSKLLDIEPIPGIDFRNGVEQKFVGIAKNNDGFQELNSYLSRHLHGNIPFPDKAPDFKNAFVIYPFQRTVDYDLKPYEFVGVSPAQVRHLPFSDWKNHQEKLVVLHSVSFGNFKEFEAHRLLRAIDNNTLLSKLSETELGNKYEIIVSEERLEAIFQDYPTIVQNTKQLLDECSIHFEFGPEYPHKNLRSYTNNEELDFRLMRKLCFDGLPYRYKQTNKAILERIENELYTIKEKGFVSYFLIAWKVLKYARSQGYFYVGRGSGANSIVAYLLRITDVDPIELDLYFERFINLFRQNPPDFDIDFSWRDREDVTDFIFRHFPNVSLIATYSTFKSRSTIRELSKIFGLPDDEIKRLQRDYSSADEVGKLILYCADFIAGFPSHLSVHAGGVIISENPIHYYTATSLPPKGFPITHFDMHIAEDVGLFKFDILGQRGLGKIKDAISILKENQNLDVDIHDIQSFQHDPNCNQLLAKGNAIGCFYVESPAMRMLLRKLEVDDYLGLVAASSVIRPGVAQSGMMQEYIRRHRSEERRKWAQENLAVLYNLMPETYGVMVYQEDVIKVAHYFAGLTVAEADMLRRGMSGKFRGRQEFLHVEEKFFSNCKELGHSDELTHSVWNQILSFGGYAFAKGHSASYAVESYQCLYLKAYYPLEFLVATVNNGGGFYSRELYLHEARMHGATIHLPCVNRSDATTNIYGKDIFIGLGVIKGLESETLRHLLLERIENGAFSDLRDVVKRVPVSLEQLRLLIRIGAFRFTGKDKKTLLWDAHLLLGHTKISKPEKKLFDAEAKEFKLPELWYHELESAYDEIELLGFPVTVSPFNLIDRTGLPTLTAAEMSNHVNETVDIIGYRIHVKGTSTKNQEKMNFGTLIDLDGHWIDSVHFPPVAAKYPFRGPGVYKLRGKVTEDFGHISLEVQMMRRIPNINIETPNTRVANEAVENGMKGANRKLAGGVVVMK